MEILLLLTAFVAFDVLLVALILIARHMVRETQTGRALIFLNRLPRGDSGCLGSRAGFAERTVGNTPAHSTPRRIASILGSKLSQPIDHHDYYP